MRGGGTVEGVWLFSVLGHWRGRRTRRTVSSSVRWSWLLAARVSTSASLRAPRRREYVEEVGRRGGRGVQRKEPDGGGAEGLGTLLACPVRVREVLNAEKEVEVVIRFDDGLRRVRPGRRWRSWEMRCWSQSGKRVVGLDDGLRGVEHSWWRRRCRGHWWASRRLQCWLHRLEGGGDLRLGWC